MKTESSDIFVHPLALVESDRIGRGTRIWAWAHIMPGAVIGEDCNICDHVFVETGAIVGRGVTIKNGVMIWKGVVIEDYVFIGPNAIFTNDRYPRSTRMPEIKTLHRTEADWLVPTRVKVGASIGANATIIAGVTIGEYALVAAGSVVTRDVQPYTWVAGNPARPKGYVTREGIPLKQLSRGVWQDPRKGELYKINADGLLEPL